MKTTFKRFVSFTLSFAFLFLMLGDMSFQMNVEADPFDNYLMHIIVNHWHVGSEEPETEGTTVNLDDTTNGRKPEDYKPKPRENETFAGFAVSAGYEAVELDNGHQTDTGEWDRQPCATVDIKKAPYVPLVKIHIFYSEVQVPKVGENLETGTTLNKYPQFKDEEIDTVTKDMVRKAVKDDIGNSGKTDAEIIDDLVNELWNTFGSDTEKIYDTSTGLHTDKTAAPVYSGLGTTGKDNEDDGTRTFDINLEAWYADIDMADIGLVIDASGSMAFVSDNVTPITAAKLDAQLGDNFAWDADTHSVTIGDDTFAANQYIPQKYVDKFLDSKLTDSTQLGYSDYSYYIFDKRNMQSEFVPLGYWNGNKKEGSTEKVDLVPQKKDLLGYWTFDDINPDNPAQFVNKVTNGATINYNCESDSNAGTKNTLAASGQESGAHNQGFALTKWLNKLKGSKSVLLDVKPSTYNFTISFAIKNNGGGDNKKQPIIYIGNKTETAPGEEQFYKICDTALSELKSKKTLSSDEDNRLKKYKPTDGWLLYQLGNQDYLRLATKNKDAKIKNSSSNNLDKNFDYLTFVFTYDEKSETGAISGYINGEKSIDLSSSSSLDKNDMWDKANLTNGNLGILLGGFWESEDTFKYDDIVLDDLFVFNTALSSDEVSQLYNYRNEIAADLDAKGVVEVNDPIALSEHGHAMGIYDAEVETLNKDQRAGWYYVNSGSGWDDQYVKEGLESAKELKHLYGDAVVKNEISVESGTFPASIYAEVSAAAENGNTEKYVYTGSADFTSPTGGEGYDAETPKPEKGDKTPVEDPITDPAITVDPKYPRDGASVGSTWTSPCVFYFDEGGYLRCLYSTKSAKESNEYTAGVSFVYYKPDDVRIKQEELQYALGEFAAALHEDSPESRMAAVRFNTNKIPDSALDNLVMLDWTNDPNEISEMMSLMRGTHGTIKGDKSEPKNTDTSGIEQYNYGMTGGTYTYYGFKAFNDKLKERADTTRDETLGEDVKPKKYLILFTDGQDNNIQGMKDVDYKGADYSGSDDKPTKIKDTIEAANELKKPESGGYTIFTVILNSGKKTLTPTLQKYVADISGDSATLEDSKSEGTKPTYAELSTKENKYNMRYIYQVDDPQDLVNVFVNDVLDNISDSLIDYTVQDYIDPRFDIIDVNGNRIVLGKGGNITVQTTDTDPKTGKPIENTWEEYTSKSGIKLDDPEDADGFKGYIRTMDGNTAGLFYDTAKDMYFLRWDNTDIPACATGTSSLNVWSRTIRVTAKEDFIGGNGILTNGNAENENWVYAAEYTADKSSGTDHANDKKAPGATPEAEVSKGFPRTVVNVRELLPKVKGGNDVIYLGETIDPHDVAEEILKSIKYDEYTNNEYWQYLARYYINDPLEKIDTTYSDFDTAFPAAIDDILEDEDLSITLPYIYLSNTGIPEVTPNTTGTDDHKKDIIGFIKYALVQNEPEGETLHEFTTHDDEQRKYALTVTYYPLSVDGTPGADPAAGKVPGAWTVAKDGEIVPPALDKETDLADLDAYDQNRETYLNGSKGAATGTLITEKTAEGAAVYDWDKDYKPAAGAEQKAISRKGEYIIDIVRGEVVFGVEISKEDYTDLRKYFNPEGKDDLNVTYSAKLVRDYGEGDPKPVGTYTVTIPIKKDWDKFAVEDELKTVKDDVVTIYKRVVLDDTQFDKDSTEENIFKTDLPIGTYSIEEVKEEFDLGGETIEPTDKAGLPVEFEGITLHQVKAGEEDLFELLGEGNTTKTTEQLDNEAKDSLKKSSSPVKADLDPTITAEDIAALIDSNKAQLGDVDPEPAAPEYYTDYRLARGTTKLIFDTSDISITKEVVSSDSRDIKTTDEEFTFILTPYVGESPEEGKSVTLGTDDVVIDGEAVTKAQFYPSTDSDGSYVLKLKQGETATITLPKGAKCDVTEETAAGYTAYTDYVAKTELLPDGKTVNTGETLTVTNEKQVKSISISKTVTVNGGKTPLETADNDALFEFKITLSSGTSGADVNGSYDAFIGGKEAIPSTANVQLTFEEGKLTNVKPIDPDPGSEYADRNGTALKLKHDEKITIFGIPEGAEVEEVKETDNGYTPLYTPNATSDEIEVTNNRNTVDLTISKTVKNVNGEAPTSTEKDKEFKFILVLDKGTAAVDPRGKSYTGKLNSEEDSIEVTIDVDNDGYVTVQGDESAAKKCITLKHDDILTINGLPENVKFDVSEDTGSAVGYTPSVTLNGDPQSGSTINDVLLTADANDVKFTNTAGVGSIVISKVIKLPAGYTNATDDVNQFDINVTLTDSDKDPLSGPYKYIIYDKNDDPVKKEDGSSDRELALDEGVGHIPLRNGERAVISDLPVGAICTVSETAEGYEFSAEYPYPDEGNAVVAAGAAKEIVVTNFMKVGELNITKTISPASSTNIFDNSIGFKFTVKLEKGGAPLTGSYPVTIDSGTPTEYSLNADGEMELEIKNDQSAVIKGLPEGTIYDIKEKKIAGYTLDETFTSGASGTISEKVGDHYSASASIVNKKETADVSITKVVYEGGKEATENTDEFTVELTAYIELDRIKGLSDGDLPITGNFSEYEFDNGKTTITITNGKTVKIEGLPKGVTCEVVESYAAGYTPDYTYETNSDGSQKITIKNTKKTGSLSISKVMEIPTEQNRSR